MMRLLFSLLFLSALSPAADWTRFRGPNGSGVDSSTGLPVEFGPSKNLAWKMDVPFAHSSPIVAGGRVFLTASEGESLITLAHDATTGRQLWRRDVKRRQAHKVFKMNDAASSTPAADDTNVYVFFPDFGLIAYSLDGKERWRNPLGPFDNFYGMSTSPVLAGGLLLLLCDQQQPASYLLALDAATGKQRWKTARPASGLGWSIPIVNTPAGGQAQVVTFGSTRIDSYYLATGEPAWWMPIGSDGSMGSPVIAGDTVIVTAQGHDEPWMQVFDNALASFDKDGDGLISVVELKADQDWGAHAGWIDADHNGLIDRKEWDTARLFGLGEYGAMAIPLASKGQLAPSAVRWRFKRNLPYVPSPVLYEGVFYMVRTGGIVTSLNPATGELHKQGRTEAPGEYWASPVAADGKVFLLSEEGKLSVLRAGAAWEVLAVNDLEDESYATPAISGGRIYVRTRGHLYCFASRP